MPFVWLCDKWIIPIWLRGFPWGLMLVHTKVLHILSRQWVRKDQGTWWVLRSCVCPVLFQHSWRIVVLEYDGLEFWNENLSWVCTLSSQFAQMSQKLWLQLLCQSGGTCFDVAELCFAIWWPYCAIAGSLRTLEAEEWGLFPGGRGSCKCMDGK